MEEMSLIIAVDVPYEVQITANGIPMHEAKVEFCIPKRDISFNFPAKMIDDKKFVFTLTNKIKDLVNKTHEYKLYVYYGNARFEADTGSFNLVDKAAFKVNMSGDEEVQTLADKLKDKAAKTATAKTQSAIKKETAKAKEPKVTATPESTGVEPVVPTVQATKPTPTPTVETTTTLKEAKEALKDHNTKTIDPPVVTEDKAGKANKTVKDLLSSLNKTTTPSIALAATPGTTVDVTETKKAGKFFEEVEKMRQINERRRVNNKVKTAIKKTIK